jgi:hemolysin III
VVSPLLGWHLLTLAGSLAARIAGVVYAASMLVCFGVSAAYHRLARSPRAQQLMQRLDHGAIFLLVAGTYTPLLVLSFNGYVRLLLLALVWSVAAAGFAGRLTDRLKRAAGVLYLALGWSAIVLLPFMFHRLGPLVAALLVAGGLVYTAGAVLFFLRRPRLSDRVFGFHEFWHSMTLIAGSAHYVAIALLFVRLA